MQQCAVTADLNRHLGQQARQQSFGEAVEAQAAEMLDSTIDLAEAADHVLGFTSWADHAPQAVAALMLGHPADQDARDLAFARDLRRRVEERIREVAADKVEDEIERAASRRSVA